MPTRRRFLLRAGALGAGLLPGAAAAADWNKLLQQGQSLAKDAAPLAQSFMLGEGQEKQIGAQYYPDYIKQSGGAYPDADAQKALKEFARPYLATSERDFDWEITLVQNDTVNAWALPGGKIAVHSGLVGYAQHPDELGSVISHEIGHAELSHGAQQIRTQTFMSTVSGAGQQALAAWGGAAGALSAKALGALEGPVFKMVNAGYSRKREFEADAHILQVFDKTGSDPARADDFFRTLNKLYPPKTEATTSLFSTHPGTEERIRRIEAQAKTRKRPATSKTPPGWAALKQRLPSKTV